jgi:SAM-dependent methyltransferase
MGIVAAMPVGEARSGADRHLGGDRLGALLRCPQSGLPLEIGADGASTPDGRYRYRIVSGQPILIDFAASVVDPANIEPMAARSSVARKRHSGISALAKRLVSPSKASTSRNLASFVTLLKAGSDHPRVLVIGGGTIGHDMGLLHKDPGLDLISFDIYSSEQTDFVADAHAIPLVDAAVDGVVIQAVLEHVLDPALVVREIWRVLKDGGLVYAETPFLQQVHEGAYDFMRYTESGHRYLFRRFALIASGSSGGAGTQLLWSLDYFARSLFRSRIAGKAVKLACCWLQLFDRAIPERYNSDTASGSYFLGRKAADAIGPKEAVGFYRGAQ